MFVLSHFIIALANILDMILSAFSLLIVFRALISWVNPDPFNPIVQFLNNTTEPILRPIRERLPIMGIDISPWIVFVVIIFLKSFLIGSLYDLAARL